jgi:hypothetical protein
MKEGFIDLETWDPKTNAPPGASDREGGKVRQQIIGTLGRRDHLVASGELDGLLRSLAKFSEKLFFVNCRK